MKPAVELSRHAIQDAVNIATGLFRPLRGFLTGDECRSVLERMQLPTGEVWTIPVTLELDAAQYARARQADCVALTYQGEQVGYLRVADVFQVDLKQLCRDTFGTTDPAHPGVAFEFARGSFRIGGESVITSPKLVSTALHPDRLRDRFRRNGWQTVVGFQTRNPIHRAHEYLQRIGLEICDGLFVNPLVGWRQAGEFSEAAIWAAYTTMAERFFPPDRVHIDGLRTSMRYAGPREAIFHALLRRNAGCTHFIIGRDHAGVAGFYDKYAAHQLARQLMETHNLGITLLLLNEPYHCLKCRQIVTERSCGHPDAVLPVAGSIIREAFKSGHLPDARLMRPEIAGAIMSLGAAMFTTEETPDETSNPDSRTVFTLPDTPA
jgi:sulfate adenylyltransferase